MKRNKTIQVNHTKKDNNKLVIKGGYVRTKLDKEELDNYMKSIRVGNSAHKSKKDYTRKPKHKGVGSW